MMEQGKRRSRLQWLLWSLFVLLLLAVGLGPMLLLVSYTRDFHFLNRFNPDHSRQVEQPPAEMYLDSYVVQYIYRFCNHSRVFEPDGIPDGYTRPSTVLTTIVEALQKSDTNIKDLLDYLNGTAGWHLASARVGEGSLFFTLTYLNDLCPECEGKFYLGIAANDFIAVFEGEPPAGRLHQITEYKVKDIHRADLERGVPFQNEAEMLNLLQNYTS
jgi:hypothetical protein